MWHEHSLAERPPCNKFIGFPIFELDTLNKRAISHINSCDHIFVASHWASDIIKKHSNIDVSVVPLGVDTNIFNQRNYVDHNKCRFFSCGKWEIRKGHDIILEAFKRAFPSNSNDNVELNMMCTNNFPQAKKFANQMESYYSSDHRVNLLPRVVHHHEVADVMSHMDCGIFMARAEGWNLELLEMMALGKHVIATYYSAHTQFCNDDNAMLVHIVDTEPALDGIWFNGSGNWAALNEDQINQAAKHMKDFYEIWKRDNDIVNHKGIETGKKFTWAESVKTFSEKV